jgi:hypothetical protein
MSEWKVHYRDQLDQDRTSGSVQTKEAALKLAKDLHDRRAQLYKIEDHDGQTLTSEEIKRWMSAHR